MSKKSKGAIFGSTGPFNGGHGDAKTLLKHQTLVEDYHDLQREANAMRSKLEAARHRKTTLAAEVRFLRKRRNYLVGTKSMGAINEQILLQSLYAAKQTKNTNKQLASRKRPHSVQHGLPPLPEAKPKKPRNLGKSPNVDHKKKSVVGKVTIQLSLTPVSVLSCKANLGVNDSPLFDLNLGTTTSSGKEVTLPTRALIFDLNEISTGEEDFQSNVEDSVKLEEAKKSLIEVFSDEHQNVLKLATCRNSGEGSSHAAAKRKISWQDPVAILQAKSDANTSGSKRKVDEPTADPISHKKAREEWS